ncbi:hypothetical protein ESZ36_08520 [Colwellia demingiae]|uniref:Uncharacterized protein n=1 Tax=Colwellia demingiae TaxID=89401 RepID=A0A5C6QIU2_9GAMM|nr:hypothetical protein [Colwellia demingiae]TWX68528.1 hypothetical protein ESZ36_08520 [Colwellia demingiae]
MTTNNIICLEVNELYTDKQFHQYKTTLPSFCFFELTQELQATIDEAKELLLEKGFHELSFQLNSINWFFKLTNRYHHDIKSFIHIGEKSIHFSGQMRPFDDVHFCTPKISINQAKFNQIPIKPIQISQLKEPLAKGLITRIEQLTRQYNEAEDLYYGIEPLLSELQKLDDKSAMDLHLHLDSQLDLLHRQGNELLKKMKNLEEEMLSLSRAILHKVFGISKGDWISYLAVNSTSLVQLQYEHCDIHERILTIRGVGIKKKGELGKREQMISIELMSKE